MKSVKLIENFVTWQGEGPDSGQTMIILRFKTCNLKCPWCDTQVKMRVSAEAPYLLSDIQKTIDSKRAGILITGGEPTVDRHIDDTLLLLNELKYPIANVETNGYNIEKLIEESVGRNVKFIYSPKIFTKLDYENAQVVCMKLLDDPRVHIKIVWDEGEFGWINAFCAWLSQEVKDKAVENQIWLMPEGATKKELLGKAPIVFDKCEEFKFNFSSRSHIIYGFV